MTRTERKRLFTKVFREGRTAGENQIVCEPNPYQGTWLQDYWVIGFLETFARLQGERK